MHGVAILGPPSSATSPPGDPQAVKDDWYFQMYYDDLPVWGFIGKMEKIIKNGLAVEQLDSNLRYYLFTHIEFDIKYNEDKVGGQWDGLR